MKRRTLLLTLVLCALMGCASVGTAPSTLPYDAWSLGFSAPDGMSVWIEAAEVEDVRGHLFARLESGSAAINYSGSAAGWPRDIGLPGKLVTGAALPKRVYVRWQSLVEPQTYSAVLDIPEEARELMLSKEKHRLLLQEFYRDALVVGVAPGGWVKAWVHGAAGTPIEVLCMRAKIEPKGPDQGEYGGHYVALNQRAKAYLVQHPVPYGSWDCGK